MLSGDEWQIVRLSLWVSGIAVLAALPLSVALAWLLARVRFPGKAIVDGVIHLPLVLPPVVIGWLLLIAFGLNGPIGSRLHDWFGVGFVFHWTGAALAAAIMALPLMVRAIRLSIEAVDPRLEGAARTLGAGRWRTFRTVTLPLSVPGIVAALVLGFARSLGEFGATITFAGNIPGETRTLPLAIYAQLQVPGMDAAVMRLAAMSVALSLAALVASEVLTRRGAFGAGAHVL
ncbi:molybdate ABC transporter permease subunit [Sphingomonas quercus]|uniref:Molybdenum transport system permease n=1 Tax=Sphingomonas quercus TaxID=2842451 RepID=A0ABS6BLN3_9SPHN|nr:molybdate ABC transporter permease subunit [Sphingomonas quercus]MBU3079230.1 molybdate ABC transporter permease subunit [Sphingomonas quercus]